MIKNLFHLHKIYIVHKKSSFPKEIQGFTNQPPSAFPHCSTYVGSLIEQATIDQTLCSSAHAWSIAPQCFAWEVKMAAPMEAPMPVFMWMIKTKPLQAPWERAFGSGEMCESYARSLLRVSVAQMCQAVGWDAVQLSACDLLSDVLERYVQQLARSCHRYSELCESFNSPLWPLKQSVFITVCVGVGCII